MRECHIKGNPRTSAWIIYFYDDNKVAYVKETLNYHDLGSIVSNWIVNGWIDDKLHNYTD